MNKRFNYILLNGKRFVHDTKHPVTLKSIGSYGDITDAYASPSSRKVYIYNDWFNWFRVHDGDCGVCSKNSSFFSISGYVRDENGKLWQCYITPAHNYCYEVIEG